MKSISFLLTLVGLGLAVVGGVVWQLGVDPVAGLFVWVPAIDVLYAHPFDAALLGLLLLTTGVLWPAAPQRR